MDPLTYKVGVLKYKALGIGCLDSGFITALVIFMKILRLKKFLGENPLYTGLQAELPLIFML